MNVAIDKIRDLARDLMSGEGDFSRADARAFAEELFRMADTMDALYKSVLIKVKETPKKEEK